VVARRVSEATGACAASPGYVTHWISPACLPKMAAVTSLRLLCLCQLALVPLAAGAQVAPAPRPATHVRVSGIVRDTLFQGLRSVRVQLKDDAGRVIYTNERGRFDMDSVPIGTRVLLFSRAGYNPMNVEAEVTPQGAGVVDIVLDAIADLPGATQSSALTGIVMDTLGQPVSAAIVSLAGGQAETRTDSLGRFVLPRAAARIQQIVRVRKLGYSAQLLQMMIPDGEVTRVTVTMRPPARDLGTVLVQGQRIPKRLEGFERRRRFGQGYYLTPEQIERRNAIQVSDLLRQLAGVRVSPNSRGQATVFGRGQCLMNVMIDGMNIPIDDTTPIDGLVTATDVLSVEAYPDGASAPAELMASARGGGCGVIVITTK
jgi:hypothetical protein